MPTQVQFRRGTTVQNNNFTGAAGEITVNTSNSTLRVHDGTTIGGVELANRDFASNASSLSSGTLSVTRLATSGVSADTYGGAAQVPVLTIDTYGRVTSAANVSVAGVTNFAFEGNTFTISTADGNSFNASITSGVDLVSPDLLGIPLAPTAAAGTNTTQIATTAFVRTEITNLVDAAPATLDTLNELAAALGDDPNFATSTATLIGNAYNQANTATTSASSAFNYANTLVATVAGVTSTSISNAQLLSGILTVDGTGSTLDADLLDGQQGSYYSNVNITNDTTTNATMYPMWVTSTSGNLPPKVTSSKLTFNPSTGLLTSTDYNSSSDARLKNNITTIDNALDKIMNLRGVTFDWNESGQSSMGLIAQEVQQVIPNVVCLDESGYLGIKYTNIIGVLVEAIKDQQKQIDTLKTMLNSKED